MTVPGRRLLRIVVLLAPCLIGAAQHVPVLQPSPLYKNARELLAIARAQGRTEVTLLVAAVPKGTAAVAGRAAEMGGEVRFRDDEVDYLRVRLPIDRASAFAEFNRIESVTLDLDERDTFMVQDIEGMKKAKEVASEPEWPPRWSDYPLTNPYRAIRDIDGEEFQAKNPSFDGRGVTIAVLDGHIDFLLPEYQTAYDLDGRSVPKMADMIITADPRESAAYTPQWVDMREQVVAEDGKVKIGEKSFTTPRNGTFRIGIFDERRFFNASYIDQDIDRNGNPRGDDGKFGVLWDEATNEVWIDTDRDLSFADQKPMTDYIVRQDTGIFGVDDPKTKVRESIGFTVQTDRRNKFVAVNVGIYQHPTMIMGHVMGNTEPNGRVQGVAPGVRFVSVFYGYGNAHGLLEGLIAAFRHPLVDIVVLEQSTFIASDTYHLSDGRHPISIVAQRLIEETGKLMFVPGNNDPAFGNVGEDGAARDAISVGGYQHRDSYRINTGFEPEADDNMHWGGLSHGPSGIGALKPDLLAPSGQVSVDIGFSYRELLSIRRGLYQLPPGYVMDGGTSTAAPMAAGAAALVISAAKQTGLKYDATRLKPALLGSARFSSQLSAHEQGNGIIQVAAAYRLLEKLQDSRPIDIRVSAPVRTTISPLLKQPNTGVGIFEREGWTIGDRGTRVVTLTRTSGPKQPMSFALSWQGNDGTFTSPASVTLPLNRPVEVPVEIAVATHGPHSGILSLTHPDIPGYAHRILNTVVAALRPTAANNYKVEAELVVPEPGDRGFFVEVPAGAAAINVVTEGLLESTAYLIPVSPGRKLNSTCVHEARSGMCTIEHPEPGVWEFNVYTGWSLLDYNPQREQPGRPTNVKATATIVGVDVMANTLPASIQPGQSFEIPLMLTNRFASASIGLVPEPLGSAYQATRSIRRGEQHMYEVNVPEGSSTLHARIGNVSSGADLDLYLLDCTIAGSPKPAPLPEKEWGNKSPAPLVAPCRPQSVAASVQADGVVEVRNPAPGRWVIVVDAYAAPNDGVMYDYIDIYQHPRFGSVSVSEIEGPRAIDARWSSNAHVWIASEPEEGRTLLARLTARSKQFSIPGGTPSVLGWTEITLRK